MDSSDFMPQQHIKLNYDNTSVNVTTDATGFLILPVFDDPGTYELEHCWACTVGSFRHSYCIHTTFPLEDCEEMAELQLIINAQLRYNETSPIEITDNFGNIVVNATVSIVFPSGFGIELPTDEDGRVYFTPNEVGTYFMVAEKDPVMGVVYRPTRAFAPLKAPEPLCGNAVCDRSRGENYGNCPADCDCECLVFTVAPAVYVPCGITPPLLIILSAIAGLLAYKTFHIVRKKKYALTAAMFLTPICVALLIELLSVQNQICDALGGSYCWNSWCLAMNIAGLEILALSIRSLIRHFYKSEAEPSQVQPEVRK